MEYICTYTTPQGEVILTSDGEFLTGLRFNDGVKTGSVRNEKDLPVFELAKKWLDIYFGGGKPDFTPPVRASGTEFQREVWGILETIPYGGTTTYGEIAGKLAAARKIPKMSAQAVGGAVGRNPVSLIVPCHRVIGAHGRLVGYGGGLERKAALLLLEGVKIK